MKKICSLLLVLYFFTILPNISVSAAPYISGTIEKDSPVAQPRFTNITVFYNYFNITDGGKAVLSSSIDARNVDRCEVNIYLQKYQNGNWTVVNHWSATENGNSCFISKSWYVMSGYAYRMLSLGYVYQNGLLIESVAHITSDIYY